MTNIVNGFNSWGRIPLDLADLWMGKRSRRAKPKYTAITSSDIRRYKTAIGGEERCTSGRKTETKLHKL